jgi:WD40 repeat protein
VNLSRNGRWLVYSENEGWHLWDLAAWKEIAFVPLRGARTPLFLPGERGLLVFTSDSIHQWPLTWPAHEEAGAPQIAAPQMLLHSSGSEFQRGSLTPDGETVAVAGGRTSVGLRLKESASSFKLAQTFGQSMVTASPDHQWIVTATHNGPGVSLWDARGQFVRLLIAKDNCAIAFSPDGHTLVSSSSREYCFWSTRDWQVRHRVKLDLGAAVPGPIAFSADGRLLALAANRQDIQLLNPETGSEFATLRAPDSRLLHQVVFSGDGSHLAAMIDGRAIQLWDLRALRKELAAMALDWSR